MVRYSFLVRLSHPLLHAGLSRRIFDHFIRPEQHRLWNCYTNLFCGLEIDDQLELTRSFDRQVGGLSAFEDSVDVVCDASVTGREVRPVVDEPASIYKLSVAHRW